MAKPGVSPPGHAYFEAEREDTKYVRLHNFAPIVYKPDFEITGKAHQISIRCMGHRHVMSLIGVAILQSVVECLFSLTCLKLVTIATSLERSQNECCVKLLLPFNYQF